MRSLVRWLRHSLLKAFGVDPNPVIATLWLGPEAACQAMHARIRELLPGYEHIIVKPASRESAAGELYRALRHRRTGTIAALPDGWRAALINAPFRTMAFNRQGENWQVNWREPITSLLFLRGLPLHRATLRPWFWPLARKGTITPEKIGVIDGRPASPLRGKFSILSPYMPWPLSHGGAVRIYSLVKELARDFDIELFVFTENAEAPEAGPLTQYCRKITYVQKPDYREPRWSTLRPPEVGEYRSPAMMRALQGVRPLQVEYTQLAEYRGQILVEHDVTYDLYSQMYQRERRLGSWWNLYRWRRFEESAVRSMRPVVMSDKDAAMLGVGGAVVIGNGVDLERFTPVPEKPGRRVLFVGSFRHFPNISAFAWFWREVWPLLKDCELTVVGGPDPEQYWRAFTDDPMPSGDGLRLLGFVADVKPLYEEANVVVVPTLVSAGTNLKVLEAMAMMRAMVSTPSGVAGIGLEAGRDVLVAEQPEAFASAINELLSDAARRQEMAERASQLAHARYSWKSLARKQAALWNEVSTPPVTIEQGPSPTREFVSYPAIVARFQGATIAHLTWRELAPGEQEILWLETVPQYRRQHLAERLLDALLEAHPGTWFLEVRQSNEAAAALYRKFGFRETGRRKKYYRDPEEDAILMERRA